MTLVRLGRCPGWSESSLGAQSLRWFCHVAAHLELGHCKTYTMRHALSQNSYEPQHDKTNKMACAPNEDWTAWASAQSDQSSLCAHWVAKDPRFLHADSQTLIRLGRSIRPVWSESSLGAQIILLVLSCYGSYEPAYPCMLSTWRRIGSLSSHRVPGEDWSDHLNVQANMSLPGHTLLCKFCCSLFLECY